MLLRRVEPVYPIIAQRARIEGTVELRAIISKDGMIEGLQRISGHPLLVTAAMDAVRQWRYRPYMLNERATGSGDQRGGEFSHALALRSNSGDEAQQRTLSGSLLFYWCAILLARNSGNG